MSNTLHNPPAVGDLLTQITQFHQRLAQALDTPNTNWHTHAPNHNAWHLVELVCHLRDVEREVHQYRFQQILTKNGAFIAGVNPDEWAEPRQYRQQDGARALAEFLTARTETIAMLKLLKPLDWQKFGNHAFFGPTTLHELLHLIVKHDEAHWEQIEEMGLGSPSKH